MKERVYEHLSSRKKFLIGMKFMGFNIYDIGYVDGVEFIAIKKDDGSVEWCEIDDVGTAFSRLFKGAIRKACEDK
jgi:hypothetical protein